MSSLDEEKGGVHPEDGGVGELEHGDQEGGENVLALPDPLHHVMEVSHSKEQGTDYDSPELRVIAWNREVLYTDGSVLGSLVLT